MIIPFVSTNDNDTEQYSSSLSVNQPKLMNPEGTPLAKNVKIFCKTIIINTSSK